MYANHFQNGAFQSQGLHTTPYGELPWRPEPKAILFIFTPVGTPDEIHRSQLYNFSDTGFVDDLKDRLTNSDRYHSRADYQHDISDLGTNSIRMSSTGDIVDTSWLRNQYTFILMSDNDYSNLHISPNPKHFTNRMFYSGCFYDEPVNPSQINGRVSVNEDCTLQIMHHTSIRIKTSTGRDGNYIVPHVDHDRDIIVPNMIATSINAGSDYYLLDPHHIKSAYDFDPDTSTMQYNVDNALCNIYDRTNYTLSTKIKSPKKHLQQLVEPLFNSAESYVHASYLSSDAALSQLGIGPLRDNISTFHKFDRSAASAYQHLTPTMSVGLDPTRLYTIKDLIDRYPYLEICPVEVPYDLPIDIHDTSGQDPVSIGTSIISTCVPALMTQYGLGHAIFTYTSDTPTFIDVPGGNWTYSIPDDGISSIVPEDEVQLDKRWNAFLEALRFDAFSIIRQLFGEFEVYIASQGSGFCNVQLQLLDFHEQKAWTVTNQLIGGITSPLIGDSDTIHRNVHEYSSIIPSVSNAFHQVVDPMTRIVSSTPQHIREKHYDW